MERRRPLASASASICVLRPPRDGQSPVFAPPFSSRAERCALMCVEWIICVRSIDHARHVHGICAPRNPVRPTGCAIVAGRVRPYSGEHSFQRQPLRSTCRMPLMTRRSSARSLPRTSLGSAVRSAAIGRRLARIGWIASAAPLTAESKYILIATKLLGFRPTRRRQFLGIRMLAGYQVPAAQHHATMTIARPRKMRMGRYSLRRSSIVTPSLRVAPVWAASVGAGASDGTRTRDLRRDRPAF